MTTDLTLREYLAAQEALLNDRLRSINGNFAALSARLEQLEAENAFLRADHHEALKARVVAELEKFLPSYGERLEILEHRVDNLRWAATDPDLEFEEEE